MKAVLVVLLAVVTAAPTLALTKEEHGNITVFTPSAVVPAFVQLETIAPGVIPNGLLYYVIDGVQAGDSYALRPDDGQNAFVVGTANQCPGPDWEGHLGDEVSDGDAAGAAGVLATEFWVLCMYKPEFEVWFVPCGVRGEGGGTVPCDGNAIVFLTFGDFGEGFTYEEAP